MIGIAGIYIPAYPIPRSYHVTHYVRSSVCRFFIKNLRTKPNITGTISANHNENFMNYTYQLEKYAGLKSRHTCPECNKQREFTRYVHIETGEYLADHVGRCNRENQCGHHYTPSEYFKDNPDRRLETKTSTAHQTTSNFDSVPFDLVHKSVSYQPQSRFHQYLIATFGETETSKQVDRFHIGSSASNPGGTVFWQVDINGIVRSGKIFQYDPITGKRKGTIDWVHSKIQKKTNTVFRLRQCFFGEHQLSGNIGKPVALVESEKTAVICSVCLPDYLWLATGGVNGCRWKEKNQASVLLGRKVVLFPDLNMFDKWRQYATEIRQQLSLSIKVSHVIEQAATAEEKSQKAGYDLADYLTKSA